MTPIVMTVQRLGGTYGVIGVDWFLDAANGKWCVACPCLSNHSLLLVTFCLPLLPSCFLLMCPGSHSANIQPRLGNLVFISSISVQTITLWLQPNDIPSVTEVI